MKKIYQYTLLTILFTFSICYMAKASSSLLQNDSTDNPVVITEIIEDYKGREGLIKHSKQLTKWLIRSWDSVQTVNHTLILDTLNKGNYTKNLYRAIITSEDSIYQQEIQESQVRYSVTLEKSQ